MSDLSKAIEALRSRLDGGPYDISTIKALTQDVLDAYVAEASRQEQQELQVPAEEPPPIPEQTESLEDEAQQAAFAPPTESPILTQEAP